MRPARGRRWRCGGRRRRWPQRDDGELVADLGDAGGGPGHPLGLLALGPRADQAVEHDGVPFDLHRDLLGAFGEAAGQRARQLLFELGLVAADRADQDAVADPAYAGQPAQRPFGGPPLVLPLDLSATVIQPLATVTSRFSTGTNASHSSVRVAAVAISASVRCAAVGSRTSISLATARTRCDAVRGPFGGPFLRVAVHRAGQHHHPLGDGRHPPRSGSHWAPRSARRARPAGCAGRLGTPPSTPWASLPRPVVGLSSTTVTAHPG